MLPMGLAAEIWAQVRGRQHLGRVCASLRWASTYRPDDMPCTSTVRKRGLDVLHDPLLNKVRPV